MKENCASPIFLICKESPLWNNLTNGMLKKIDDSLYRNSGQVPEKLINKLQNKLGVLRQEVESFLQQRAYHKVMFINSLFNFSVSHRQPEKKKNIFEKR